MTKDRKRITLIKQALDDLRAGLLSDFVFVHIVSSIVNPAQLNDKDIKWAEEVLRKTNEYSKRR